MSVRSRWIGVVMLTTLAISVTACGAHKHAPHSKPPTPVVRVHVADPGSIAALPFRTAEALGLFAHEHVRVQITSRAQAQMVVGPAGKGWPVLGYLSIRPDILLMSPIYDPQFRLAALDHLPMVSSTAINQAKPWAEKILALHHVTASTWTTMTPAQIQQLWRRRHLPWVLVGLEEAQRLRAVDPKSTVLAWLGASTGPVPNVVISGQDSTPAATRFLSALNLALWYLNTTPASKTASALNQASPGFQWLVQSARHYQYWPSTTFPDQPAYNRRRTRFNPEWPAFAAGVNPKPARQALARLGE